MSFIAQDPDVHMRSLLLTDFQQYFSLMIETYWESLYVYAENIIGCTLDAEEVVQDVFTRFYLSWHNRLPEDFPLYLRSYLYTITRHCCYTHLRKRKRYEAKSIFDDAEAECLEIPEKECPEVIVEIYEAFQEMTAILNTLSSQQRQALLLHCQDGLSYREVAERLGYPEATIKQMTFRARKKIREYTANNRLAFSL